MKDPLKHKDSIRKMLEEERRSKKKNLRRRFFRGADEKNRKPFTASEEMVGVPHERPEKDVERVDVPWWLRY